MPRKRGTAIAGPDNECVMSPPLQNSYLAKIVERSRPRLRWILWKSRREVRGHRGSHCAPFLQRLGRELPSLFAISLFAFFFISTSFAIPVPLQNGQPAATVEGVVTSA